MIIRMNIASAVKIQHLLMTIVILSGCSTFTGLPRDSRDADSEKIERNISLKSEEARSFIGKDKEEIIAYYGEPSEVNYNVGKYNDATGKSDYYQEELVYIFRKGLRFINEDSYHLMFYLNNGIVENFKVFGVPFQKD